MRTSYLTILAFAVTTLGWTTPAVACTEVPFAAAQSATSVTVVHHHGDSHPAPRVTKGQGTQLPLRADRPGRLPQPAFRPAQPSDELRSFPENFTAPIRRLHDQEIEGTRG
jgi:hypothetical protein